jgi:adenylate cyclase
VLAALCERLVACGLPLHRVAVFVRTLHPNVMGRRFLWRPERQVEVSERPYRFLDEDSYLASPIALVMGGHGPIRRRLVDPECPDDFGIIEELRAEGVTDYLIQPLEFSNGEIHAVSWTTIRPGGFSENDVATLEAIVRPLARVAEIHALRRVARTLLDTYVGHGAGERILQGRIRRGDIERINAVILSTDLRGFTALSDRLAGDQVIAILNDYFDCLVPPIEAQGGEVLKFMGDGLLAIFPVGDRAAAACETALAALSEAGARFADANAGHAAQGRGAVRQCRQRRPAGLHDDRAGRQPDRAAPDALPRPRPRNRSLVGGCGMSAGRRDLARPLRAAWLRSAAGGVRARLNPCLDGCP